MTPNALTLLYIRTARDPNCLNSMSAVSDSSSSISFHSCGSWGSNSISYRVLLLIWAAFDSLSLSDDESMIKSWLLSSSPLLAALLLYPISKTYICSSLLLALVNYLARYIDRNTWYASAVGSFSPYFLSSPSSSFPSSLFPLAYCLAISILRSLSCISEFIFIIII